jgi:hypothetical protein
VLLDQRAGRTFTPRRDKVIQPFWAALQGGELLTDASAVAGHAPPIAEWCGCASPVARVRAAGPT